VLIRKASSFLLIHSWLCSLFLPPPVCVSLACLASTSPRHRRATYHGTSLPRRERALQPLTLRVSEEGIAVYTSIVMADAGQLRQRKPAEPNGSKHEATNGAHDANDEKKRKQQQQQQQVVSAPAPWDLVGQWRRLGSFFFEKDDAAFLAGFRLMWGVIMAYEAWTYMALNWGKMQFSFYSTNCPFQVRECASVRRRLDA